MKHKTLLVLNRKSAARPDVREIVKPLEKELGLSVVVPWSRKQLARLLKDAARGGVTRVIAGGGDGTLNKVSNAVLNLGPKRRPSMGLVPLGTANDFARAFGDFGADLGHSIRQAATGKAIDMDMGRINGTWFANVASGGFGAMITATTPQDVKRRLGGLAYTLTGLARLSELSPTHARLSVDGAVPRDMAISALVFANSRYAGGGFDVAPSANVQDGKLDLGLIKIDSNKPLAKLAEDGSGEFADLIESGTFSRLRLETETPFHLNLDGEPMVDTTFDVEVVPGALSFVPPTAP